MQILGGMTPQQKAAYRIIFAQLLVALAIVVLMLVFADMRAALSALLAGMICVLANFYFAKRILKYRGAQDVKKFMRAYFLGELTKLAMIVVLMLLALVFLKIDAMPFLLTFIVLQIMMSFMPLVMNKV